MAFTFKSSELDDKFIDYLDEWKKKYNELNTNYEDNEGKLSDEEKDALLEKIYFDMQNEMKTTAVQAFKNNNMAALRLIFNLNLWDFNLTADDLKIKYSPVLSLAVKNGDSQMVEFLLTEGKASACSEVYYRNYEQRNKGQYGLGTDDSYNQSILEAIQLKNPHILNLLLESIRSNEITKEKDIKIAEYLDSTDYSSYFSTSLIVEAAMAENPNALRAFLDLGISFPKAINQLFYKLQNPDTATFHFKSLKPERYEAAIRYLMNFVMLPQVDHQFRQYQYRMFLYGSQDEMVKFLTNLKTLKLPDFIINFTNVEPRPTEVGKEHDSLNEVEKILALKDSKQKQLLVDNLALTVNYWQDLKNKNPEEKLPNWLTEEVVEKLQLQTQRLKIEHARLRSFFGGTSKKVQPEDLVKVKRESEIKGPGK